jgi:hypothetical protein
MIFVRGSHERRTQHADRDRSAVTPGPVPAVAPLADLHRVAGNAAVTRLVEGLESAPRLRSLMLFEMHNASRRGSARRIEKLRRGGHNDDGTVRPDESEHVALFRQAAYALAREWHEWILTPEHTVDSERIDDDLGGGGAHVQNLFGSRFQHPDRGWFHFVNYMNEQMQRGHTSGTTRTSAIPSGRGSPSTSSCSPRARHR